MIYNKKKMSIVRIQSIWRKSLANHISIDPMLVADTSDVPNEAQDEELSAGMSYGRYTPPWRPTLNAHIKPKKPHKVVAAAVAVTSSENVEITPAEVMKIPVDPPGVYAEHGGGGGYYIGGGGRLDQIPSNSTKPKHWNQVQEQSHSQGNIACDERKSVTEEGNPKDEEPDGGKGRSKSESKGMARCSRQAVNERKSVTEESNPKSRFFLVFKRCNNILGLIVVNKVSSGKGVLSSHPYKINTHLLLRRRRIHCHY
jgi:hypothetical protein